MRKASFSGPVIDEQLKQEISSKLGLKKRLKSETGSKNVSSKEKVGTFRNWGEEKPVFIGQRLKQQVRENKSKVLPLTD